MVVEPIAAGQCNMNKTDKIYIAGHRGLVGSAIVRLLESKGFDNIITRSHGELDLTRQEQVEAFFESEKPAYVFLAAARVGGIGANSEFPARFIYDNLAIALNIIHSAKEFGTVKLINLGSSCVYPKLAPQPLKEEYLLSGLLEPTNEAYAVAKIAAIKMCRHYNTQYGTDFISLMPTNLYGPNDNFDLAGSHVLAALIRKFHLARLLSLNDLSGIRRDFCRCSKGSAYNSRPDQELISELSSQGIFSDRVVLWGTGAPFREFLHVDDLAAACLFLMEFAENSSIGEIINVGVGKDITIGDLAELIRIIVGFEGQIDFDASRPDGTPRKLLDVSQILKLGWKPRIALKQGLAATYSWYCRSC